MDVEGRGLEWLYGETGGVAHGVLGLEGCFIADRSGWDDRELYIAVNLSLYGLTIEDDEDRSR